METKHLEANDSADSTSMQTTRRDLATARIPANRIMNSSELEARYPADSNSTQNTRQHLALVQTLANQLTTLSSTIEGLRGDLSNLQTKLYGELLSSRHTSDNFPQFQRLPPELRSIIWGYAFAVPQIFVFGEEACSRSQINNIIQSCPEARKAAQAHKLDYFTLHRELDMYPLTPALAASCKNYINLHLDTIWLASSQTTLDPRFPFPDEPEFPKGLAMHCGACSTSLLPSEMFCKMDCPKYPRAHKNKWEWPIKSLALNVDRWREPAEHARGKAGTWSVFLEHRVKELLLVVGKVPPFANGAFTFTQPIDSGPSEYERRFVVVGQDKTWEETAEKMKNGWRRFKARRASARELVMKHYQVTAYEVEDMALYKGFADLSSYRTPEIEFVEAEPTCNKWTLYP